MRCMVLGAAAATLRLRTCLSWHLPISCVSSLKRYRHSTRARPEASGVVRVSMFSSTESPPIDVTTLRNPRGVDMDVFKRNVELHHSITNCEDPYMASAIKEALKVLGDALRLYGPERLIASYNGGKDAVAVMHLQCAATAMYSLQQGEAFRPRVIFFDSAKQFPEIREFVLRTSREFDMDLLVYNNSFAPGLERCIAENGGGSFGFVLGTRVGDPNCGVQTAFTPSSDWMPPFMRVNPILTWDYGHVWSFLRTFKLPYPALYDRGYTSLGRVDDTFPNPALLRRKTDDGEGGSGSSGSSGGSSSSSSSDGSDGALAQEEDEYLPAYMLSDWSLERAGRGGRDSSTMECELQDLDARRDRVRQARTAGLVVIGDEILKGKTPDSNAAFATRRFWDRGIPVKRVAVVSDSEADIADEVRRQVQAFDVVITSGGVGPTHDDVTIRAVARALGQRIRPNPDMVERLRRAFKLQQGDDLTAAQKKMALLPELSRLRTAPADEDGWPILQCENVFILPGVPQFFEAKMDVIVQNFLNERPLHRKKLVLSADEFEIVEQLDAAVAQHPRVTFGSYPYFGKMIFKTVITIEAEAQEDADAAAASLVKLIPRGLIVKVVEGDDDLRLSKL